MECINCNITFDLAFPLRKTKKTIFFKNCIPVFNVGFHQDIYRTISFKSCVMIITTKLYGLILAWMNLAFIQGHICMRKQKLLWSFSPNFSVDLGDILYAAMTFMSKFILCLFLFCMIITQGGELKIVVLKRMCLRLTCVWTHMNQFLLNSVWW